MNKNIQLYQIITLQHEIQTTKATFFTIAK